MDELKMLVEVVAGLPTLTVWVLVGYLVYKLAIVGSWFAIARLCVDKLHNWMITPKIELIQRKDVLDRLVIESCFEDLMVQLHRIRNKGNKGFSSKSNYIHTGDVAWLRNAIDEKEARDKQNGVKE
jgi:hypothetical protein